MKRTSTCENLKEEAFGGIKEDQITSKTIEGGIVSVSTKLINVVIQLLSLAILARLLNPSDFGVIAMAASVVGLLRSVKDAGLATATVQQSKITHEEVSSIFWINTMVGIVITAFLWVISPLVGWFYGDNRATRVLMVISMNFIFAGLGAQHGAMLKRAMRFRLLALVELSSQLLSKVIAVTLAFLGYGYWSLAIMIVSYEFVPCVLFWLLCPWRPGFVKRMGTVAPLVRFGIKLTVRNVINYVGYNMDNILIGRRWGASALGLYSRAYNLMETPTRLISWPMSKVAVASLSRLQNEANKYRKLYRQIVETTACLYLPLIAFIMVSARDVILLVLGEKWVAAIPVLKALGFGWLALATSPAIGWAVISSGKAGRWLKWSLIENIILTLGIAFSLKFGVLWIAVTIAISRISLKIPEVSFCMSETIASPADFWKAIARPLLASLSAGTITHLISDCLPCDRVVIAHILLVAFVMVGLYLFCYILLPGGYKSLTAMISMMRKPKSAIT